MHQVLADKQDDLSHKTDELLESLAVYDPEILQKKPNADQWSVIQVLDHLILTEDSCLQYLHKKILGAESVRDVGLKQSFLMLVSKAAYGGTFKFKARVDAINHPNNDLTLEEIRTKWSGSRSKMGAFLEDFPDAYLKKALFRHPFLGRISVPQMLTFLGDHVIHHKGQIRRVMKHHDH